VEEENAKLVIAVEPTRSACAGSAAVYLMRRIAARAGAYAPGIQERMFYDLQRDRNGRNVDVVGQWFTSNQAELSRLGYRFLYRRVAFRTEGICKWVLGGDGFRGAVLPTSGHRLHPELKMDGHHAVALIPSAPNGKPTNKLFMVDPWPGVDPSEVEPPEVLELAHRDKKYAAFVVYWSGYS
jgi:hypothetical protein